jgi:hypothetical protein
MHHHFAINCNKYYINNSYLVQIPPTQVQNANQNPQGGYAIDNQMPHICPILPFWGSTLIGYNVEHIEYTVPLSSTQVMIRVSAVGQLTCCGS